jgi:decaprenylphospho-beta-D-ribofuranose 2-oxidase
MKQTYNLKSFGNNVKINCNTQTLKSIKFQEFKKLKISNSITRGKGNSYGDSSLNSNKTFLTKNLNEIDFFDTKNGIIKCGSGVSIENLLPIIINSGWFLPVTPGSKKISIGGMIASNVHGKNQHIEGCFHNFVLSIDLLDKNKKIITCSKLKNKILFDYTIGGMGLTGIILSATIKLKKIYCTKINQKIKVFNSINQIVEDMKRNTYDYTVSWLDFNHEKSRGIIFYGKHNKNYLKKINYKNSQKKIPRIKSFLVNKLTIELFNRFYFYFNKIFKNKKNNLVEIENFFYPLDKINKWNKMYGDKGFFQYQFIIPFKNWKKPYYEIKSSFKKFNVKSYLCVMKLMKNEKKKMSFTMNGLNFAIDFKNCKNSISLMKRLDKILIKYGGIIYLAKDSRINEQNAKKLIKDYYIFKNFRKKNNLNKIFNSEQSKRINL